VLADRFMSGDPSSTREVSSGSNGVNAHFTMCGRDRYCFHPLYDFAEATLVCGVDLWRRMPIGLIERQDAYQAGGRRWREREYEVAMPYRAVAAHIPHPSSWGWKLARCEPVIRHLRRRVNHIRQEIGVELLPAAAVAGN
jgi:hypothetical protein